MEISRVIPFKEDKSNIIPMTIDNSHVTPMMVPIIVDPKFWEVVDNQRKGFSIWDTK